MDPPSLPLVELQLVELVALLDIGSKWVLVLKMAFWLHYTVLYTKKTGHGHHCTASNGDWTGEIPVTS